jgi:hypothetical protein
VLGRRRLLDRLPTSLLLYWGKKLRLAIFARLFSFWPFFWQSLFCRRRLPTERVSGLKTRHSKRRAAFEAPFAVQDKQAKKARTHT